MKTLLWIIVVIAIAAGLLYELRYDVRIDSPVVLKLDRLTGEVWVANSGAWRKIVHADDAKPAAAAQNFAATEKKAT